MALLVSSCLVLETLEPKFYSYGSKSSLTPSPVRRLPDTLSRRERVEARTPSPPFPEGEGLGVKGEHG